MMKLIPVIPVKANERKKSNENKLPPDTYKELLPSQEMEIGTSSKLVFRVTRGGELGLPMIDIRYSIKDKYSKVGITIPIDKFDKFEEICYDIACQLEEKHIQD